MSNIHKYRLHQSEITNALSGLEKRGERERGSKTTLIRMHFDAIHKATKGLMVYLWMQ